MASPRRPAGPSAGSVRRRRGDGRRLTVGSMGESGAPWWLVVGRRGLGGRALRRTCLGSSSAETEQPARAPLSTTALAATARRWPRGSESMTWRQRRAPRRRRTAAHHGVACPDIVAAPVAYRAPAGCGAWDNGEGREEAHAGQFVGLQGRGRGRRARHARSRLQLHRRPPEAKPSATPTAPTESPSPSTAQNR